MPQSLTSATSLQLNSLQTETFWTLPEQAKVMVSQVQSRDGEHTEVPMTHGSHYHRGPGSLGACSDPSRVCQRQEDAGTLWCCKGYNSES